MKMADSVTSDGYNTPDTPEVNGLSLTEYTANPSPFHKVSQAHKSTASSDVPGAFLLSNGYPDV